MHYTRLLSVVLLALVLLGAAELMFAPVPVHAAIQTTTITGTHPPLNRPTLSHTGVNGNPWGYDFSPGNDIYSPPSDFCGHFGCIANFWNGSGYVIECSDGMYSLSGGRRGACSWHGGVWRELYSH
ncbi:MAG TPA: hypothetical protein VKR06_09160 [Ktedonosporobacter sp.]|nr:hypothetical protein [Ktedonosporobacter sp.]